jgi:hypothetical protein
MIFIYSDLIKEKLKKSQKSYDELFNCGLEKIIPLIKLFADNINENFIDRIFNISNNIEILIYTNCNEFKVKNIIGIGIYVKTYNKKIKEDNIYLLLLCINNKYRQYGYGKIFMVEIIELISNFNKNKKKIILHPLESTYGFYQSLGFIQTKDKIYKFKKLFDYELYNKNKIIFELSI